MAKFSPKPEGSTEKSGFDPPQCRLHALHALLSLRLLLSEPQRKDHLGDRNSNIHRLFAWLRSGMTGGFPRPQG